MVAKRTDPAPKYGPTADYGDCEVDDCSAKARVTSPIARRTYATAMPAMRSMGQAWSTRRPTPAGERWRETHNRRRCSRCPADRAHAQVESPELKKVAKLPATAVTTNMAHASSITSMIFPPDVTGLVIDEDTVNS